MKRALTCLVLAAGLLIGTTACEDDATASAVLSDQVPFELGEHELTPAAQAQLEEFADQVRAAGAGGRVWIAGHTDDHGTESFNQALSERRAATVEDALTRLLAEIDVSFQTEGFGASEPVVPNDSDGNRTQNRRVEVSYWR